MGKAACAFDPFVEVAQVDGFMIAFGHFVEEPLPEFSGGGGESILYAEFVVFSCPVERIHFRWRWVDCSVPPMNWGATVLFAPF